MSMYRQLWLSIFASVLIALSASLFVSLLNARSYLEAQLAMKNQDNAAALSLALSQGNSNHGTVVLAVTALFNGGHYELIHVIDPNGGVVVDKTARGGDAGAPDWFVHLLPIRSLPGQAEIASGWQPLGTLTLMSSSRFAYRSLWETAMTMSAVMLAAGLLGGLLTSLVLRRITKPMRAVMEQARAINDHRFISIPLPDVPEVRELAAAMNDTVNRLRIDFEEDARRYETLRQQANFDVLTGLANRAYFLASLDSALDDEDSPYGALAIIRLRMLGKINRRQGREIADELLRRVGHALGEMTIVCSGTFAGRLNGGDFALLLGSGCDPAPTLEELLQSLPNVVVPLAGDFSTTYIGYSRFSRGDNPTRLLARIDAALAAADSEATSVVREAAAEDVAITPDGAEQWRDSLAQALADPASLSLANFPLRVGDGSVSHREAPLRLRLDRQQDWLPATRFLPLADRIGLVPQLDLATLGLAVAVLEQDSRLGGLWINISAKSIADAEFRARLLGLLSEHPATRRRLYLEIPEAGGLSRINALRDLSRDLKPLECRIGLEHYGHHFNRIGLLYDLGLDFLKVDASFIQGLDGNPGNQAFLSGLCEIAHRIGMRVYAEGVERQEDLDKLNELGFDGVSGLLVR
jgi:EAL domain-containing protein (putative c-di-GMP-specific phosphodiesterase class I)/GGDEF domain-containing protein